MAFVLQLFADWIIDLLRFAVEFVVSSMNLLNCLIGVLRIGHLSVGRNVAVACKNPSFLCSMLHPNLPNVV